MVCNLLKRARFFEEMCGARDDSQFLRTTEQPERSLIHLNHGFVVPANEQQSGSCDIREVSFCEVRSSPS